MTEIKKYSTLNLPDGSSPGSGISIVNDIYNPILINSIKHKKMIQQNENFGNIKYTKILENAIS